MRLIQFLYFYWQSRRYSQNDLAVHHALLLLSARRCAYDFKHSIGYLSPPFDERFWHTRANEWLDIFTPTGVKEYRHHLHSEINKRDSEISRLKRFLKDNNIKDFDDPTIPF